MPPPPDPPAAWREFARAPLVPVALAATVGLCADRYLVVPPAAGLIVAAVGLGGYLVGVAGRRAHPAWLWLLFAGLAAAHHHTHTRVFPADDIATRAGESPRLVRLRGTLADDPVTRFAPTADPLEPLLKADTDAVLLDVTGVGGLNGWGPASGAVRVTVERDAPLAGTAPPPPLAGLRAGDAVELTGLLSVPGGPRNPGEADYRRYLADRRIRAEVRVHDAAAVARLDIGERTFAGRLALARRVATDALAAALPARQLGPAAALLLGDTAAMDRAEWDKYVRTGVVHALAISGQHLAVLAGFLWAGMRLTNVRRVHGAAVVLGVIVGYTLLTGLRPSSVRATVMVACACGGLLLRRPTLPANSFALAWLAVVALNPADPFSLGCKFSFLCVFVLIWGVGPWLAGRTRTPLEQLVEESRSPLERGLRMAARLVLAAYAVTLALGVVTAPVQLAEQNLVSPVGLLIGPAIVLLTSVALLAGFVLMALSFVPPVALAAGVPVRLALAGCDRLVTWADAVPGGAVYLPGASPLFLAGFYALLAAVILAPRPWAWRAAAGLTAWVFGALLLPPGTDTPADELRVAVLAVGKGGCVVIETPDGRCLIYDVGTTAGPAAVRRVVAPYLWHRGVRRIDELFVSHADYDHFNGVGELLRRFPVGQVTLTPSFADKPTREVAGAITAIRAAGVPTRLAFAGQTFTAGDVTLEVLHPPPTGPPGTENERSLVLLVTHAGHTILLSGDLEKAGTQALLATPPRPATVLMAPHHGSRPALPPRLVEWCRPKLVVVSRGPPLGNSVTAADVGGGVPVWDTFTSGAVTLRSHKTGLVAEAFRTGERAVVARGRP